MSALFSILTKLSNRTCLIGTREYVPKLNLAKTDSVHRAGARFAYGENADQVRKWHECTCSSLKSPFCRRQKFLMSVPYCSSSSSSKNESQTDTIFSPYNISNHSINIRTVRCCCLLCNTGLIFKVAICLLDERSF